MRFDTIADIYSANRSIRERLAGVLSTVTQDEATARPGGETWSIQEIVEHLTMVEFGTARICTKLLNEARQSGKLSNGWVELSAVFAERSAKVATQRLEAPDRVHPTGKVTLPEALKRMDENKKLFDGMRADLERYDLSKHKFPHPYFGDITAAEWLVILGGHELRHTKQIEKLLEKLRK
jgi:uncharacterized damage-inducible protein DinB